MLHNGGRIDETRECLNTRAPLTTIPADGDSTVMATNHFTCCVCGVQCNRVRRKSGPFCEPCYRAQRAKEWRLRNPEYHKAWKAKNDDKVKKYARTWRAKNPDYGKSIRHRRMLSHAKHRAKRDGVPFCLDAYIQIPDRCPICDRLIERGDGRPTKSSPSLDRLVPVIGYTHANSWVICNGCNQAKGGATPRLMRRILAEIAARSLEA